MASDRRPLPECGFAVDSTKKGAVPIKVESRAKGKKVTILSNVRGDGSMLCSTLTSLLGIGGTVLHESGQQLIQLQGSQEVRVVEALRQLKCLRGVKEDEKQKKPAKQAEVASRNCGYDKFLRQESKPSLAKMLEGEAYAPKCLPGAECFRWHGYWVYCRGCCEQTDDDVWEESARFCDPSLDRPYSEEQLVGAPRRPTNVSQLDEYLRKLGMLAEVGEAALTWGLRNPTWPSPLGTTLAEYRRAALAPGAKLLEMEPKRRELRSNSKTPKEKVKASTLQPASRSKSQPVVKAPQEEGCFRCPVCQHHFALYKTLKDHMKLSHNQNAPAKNLVAYTPPKLKPRTAVSRGTSVPRAVKSTVRWGQNRSESIRCKVESKAGPCDESGPLDDRPTSSAAPREPIEVPRVEEIEDLGDIEEEFPQQTLLEDAEREFPSLDCCVCQKRFSFQMLQEFQEHVEKCINNPPATQSWQECPVCQEKFHPDAIEAHARSCLDRAEENVDDGEDSDASDGIAGHPVDLQGYPVVRVVQAFQPEIWDDTQVSVVKGDLFLRLWQQPTEEGGYWAWGCLVTWERNDYYGVKLGYVPRSHLAEEPLPVAETPEVEPVRRWGRR